MNPPKKQPQRRRSNRKPAEAEAPRTVEVAENTLSKMQGKEGSEITVETPEPKKYSAKPRVGQPTVGRSPNYVKTVGLGKLKVTTANGNTNV